MAGLIGNASKFKDGLLSSIDYSNNSLTIQNNGDNNKRIYEIKNFYNDRCLITVISRTNGNDMGFSMIGINSRTHKIFIKSNETYYKLYEMGEDYEKRYFIIPRDSYGSVEMKFMNERNKIEIEDVTDSVNVDDLTQII